MTTKLTPLYLDENTIIYIEATGDLDIPAAAPVSTSTEETEDEEEVASSKGLKEDFQKHIKDLQSIIFAYTSYSLAAFKQVATANVDKVMLEFGVEIGGETGIPYITKGTARSNLKIQVECSFKDT